MPTLANVGRYFYGDYCAGNFESFVMSGGSVTSEVTTTASITPSIEGFAVGAVTSFGEDARGELYVMDRGVDRGHGAGVGEVFKVVPVLGDGASGINAPPFLLGANWTWENLWLSSSHPIDQYRVYRMTGTRHAAPTPASSRHRACRPARGPSPSGTGGIRRCRCPGDLLVRRDRRAQDARDRWRPGRLRDGPQPPACLAEHRAATIRRSGVQPRRRPRAGGTPAHQHCAPSEAHASASAVIGSPAAFQSRHPRG